VFVGNVGGDGNRLPYLLLSPDDDFDDDIEYSELVTSVPTDDKDDIDDGLDIEDDDNEYSESVPTDDKDDIDDGLDIEDDVDSPDVKDESTVKTDDVDDGLDSTDIEDDVDLFINCCKNGLTHVFDGLSAKLFNNRVISFLPSSFIWDLSQTASTNAPFVVIKDITVFILSLPIAQATAPGMLHIFSLFLSSLHTNWTTILVNPEQLIFESSVFLDWLLDFDVDFVIMLWMPSITILDLSLSLLFLSVIVT